MQAWKFPEGARICKIGEPMTAGTISSYGSKNSKSYYLILDDGRRVVAKEDELRNAPKFAHGSHVSFVGEPEHEGIVFKYEPRSEAPYTIKHDMGGTLIATEADLQEALSDEFAVSPTMIVNQTTKEASLPDIERMTERFEMQMSNIRFAFNSLVETIKNVDQDRHMKQAQLDKVNRDLTIAVNMLPSEELRQVLRNIVSSENPS
jgi:hypothetical protein